MLWQFPVGNTLYLPNNNTSYHYQDNRTQYFLALGNTQNISKYVAQGVVGLLIGNGQDTDTDYMDYANDGITNPPAIDGNTLVAPHADDDGGFLRTATEQYYAAGPISTSASSSPTPTFAIGAKVETTLRPMFT